MTSDRHKDDGRWVFYSFWILAHNCLFVVDTKTASMNDNVEDASFDFMVLNLLTFIQRRTKQKRWQ